MVSYLVNLILLSALLFTSFRVTKMHRELVRLRTDQGDFAFILGKTTETVNDLTLTLHEFSADGKQLVHALGDKIEQARKVISDMENPGDVACAPAQATV